MRAKILVVTDLTYPARGRRYGEEDAFLTRKLREHFDVALCHPLDAVPLMDAFDAVVVRNCGPVLHFPAEYDEFRTAALARGTRVFNQLTGKADMIGKQYLVDLTLDGHPVTPTISAVEGSSVESQWGLLPEQDAYIVKPKLGSDSIGLRTVTRAELTGLSLDGLLAQPLLDFHHEISFYFVDRDFQYALYAPDPAHRWELEPYPPTGDDLVFAQHFVDWNAIDHGIQRVDACRLRSGELLLVELEDLNPFLSLERTDDATRESFVERMAASLCGLLAAPALDKAPMT